MLRFTILASTFPMALIAMFARGGIASSAPCIATGGITVQMAQAPWQAQAHVAFTDDPAQASVRVQIVDRAETADFAVIDDVESAESGACTATAATRFIGIAATPSGAEPVIYLTDSARADYRIYVHSRSFTPRNAAALIVGAHRDQRRLAAL
ncbi:MAG: hypothetical protein ABWY18_08360 [Tardiphaga sp.]